MEQRSAPRTYWVSYKGCETLEKGMTKSRLYAIWYACIALGFLLLGIHRVVKLHGDGALLRFIIAAGFAALAFLQSRSRV
jgi:hypothetical protein